MARRSQPVSVLGGFVVRLSLAPCGSSELLSMIPSSVKRWSLHGRPGRRASCGVTGSRTIHNSSLTTPSRSMKATLHDRWPDG